LIPLTKAETRRKAKLEEDLKPCLEAFGRCGAALEAIGGAQSLSDFLFAADTIRTIHAEKLYRPQTWAAWCKSVCGHDVRWVERNVKAAAVMAEIGSILPISQASVLLAAPEGTRAAVHQAATSGGETTAEELGQLTAKMLGADSSAEAVKIVQESAERIKKQKGCKIHAAPSDSERIGQIERLADRCRKIHAGIVDRADRADAALNSYLAIVRGDEEAERLAA